MKCPRCWSPKAYRNPAKGWKGLLWSCLLLVPMKCHHCYHKFVVFWFATFGQTISPPVAKRARTTPETAYITQFETGRRADRAREEAKPLRVSRRAA